MFVFIIVKTYLRQFFKHTFRTLSNFAIHSTVKRRYNK